MLDRTNLTPGSRLLFNLACVVVVVFGLRAARTIVVPIALALFLTIISLPLLTWLKRQRIPNSLAVFLTIVVNIAVLGFFVLIISQSVDEIRIALPRYVEQFQVLIADAQLRLIERFGASADFPVMELINVQQAIQFMVDAARHVAVVVANAFLVLIIMIFMLQETAAFPGKLKAVLGGTDADVGRFAKITFEVQHYLGIKTVVSLITGFTVGVWVWILGIDFPLFWGTLAFLFNYIPSVGSIIASIPPIMLGLLQFGVGRALLVAIGYLVVNVTLGNLLEPNLMGRRLGLSTLVVILSLVFWGFVLGPVGMLLAVPMTMIVKIWLENTRDLRWLAVMLGKSAPEARSQLELAQIAEPEPG
jgi:AI-2 transport protein TqsA